MKTVVYDALTKTVTIIDTPDEMLDEQPGETVPTIEARVAVIEETLTIIAEVLL